MLLAAKSQKNQNYQVTKGVNALKIVFIIRILSRKRLGYSIQNYQDQKSVNTLKN